MRRKIREILNTKITDGVTNRLANLFDLSQEKELGDGKMFVYNIAVKRPDGKVECDTLYSVKFLDQVTCDGMADEVKCPTILCMCGVLNMLSDEEQKAFSYHAAYPKETPAETKEEVKDDKTV